MAGVDELFQARWTAIGILDRIGQHAVVAPISSAWELSHGHQLDSTDAELLEVWQMADDRFESPFRRERAHVQLVKNVIAQWSSEPILILPGKRRIKDLARAMHIPRLELRRRVRPIRPFVQAVKVARAWRDPFQNSPMVSVFHAFQTFEA